jgi:spore maturation protein CgeB
MKILFTSNKTYRGSLDGGWWYFYLPLRDMGHDVYFYDTVSGDDKTYSEIIETFKPDLIFCIMTGDAGIAPLEPWQDILNETKTGRTKTFNWFCDDTWRYDNFSKNACHYFNACSTPEKSRVADYKKDGYNNIIVANWHANSKFYEAKAYEDKKTDISFIGYLTTKRKSFFNRVDFPITFLSGITQEELFDAHTTTKIGINLSHNDNDTQGKTQMKQRMFEVPAGGGMLLTQYHEGIEDYYKIDSEIVTFKDADEFCKKAKFLMDNPNVSKNIAERGYRRFIREHDSSVRLNQVLQEIGKL